MQSLCLHCKGLPDCCIYDCVPIVAVYDGQQDCVSFGTGFAL